MANQYVNKVVIGSEVKLDLTSDTVTAATLLSGVKAHDKSGAQITGSCEYDADTSDATAAAAEILKDKTAYVGGSKITGTMPNKGAVSLDITSLSSVAIPMGFHDGSGTAQISSTEAAKLVATNIRKGITVLGITGTMDTTEGVTPQAKTVTPTFSAQEITPDSPTYNYLSSVTVDAIPVSYVDNAAGGQTLTVGG